MLPLAVMLMLSFASPVTAQLKDLRITITSIEEDKVAPGSTFKVDFELTVPAGVTLPRGGRIYTYAFYFVDDRLTFANVPFWELVPRVGDTEYVPENTRYSLKIQIKRDAPVGQRIFVAVGWYIELDENWAYSEADNRVTVVIAGTRFTENVENVRTVGDHMRYFIRDDPGWDVYVRTKRPEHHQRLYITGSRRDVEIRAADTPTPPPTPIPWPLIGGTVAALALVGVITAFALKKRRAAGELPPPPPKPRS